MQTRALTRAFTLVEIVVVVIVIGILAALVVPKYTGATTTSAVTATAEDLRSIELAVDMYYAMHASYPPDVTRMRPVRELDEFFKGKTNPFAKPCPMGGVYDWEGSPRWNPPQVAIRKNNDNVYAEADAQALDDLLDDGDLSSGRFQRDGTARLRFYIRPD